MMIDDSVKGSQMMWTACGVALRCNALVSQSAPQHSTFHPHRNEWSDDVVPRGLQFESPDLCVTSCLFKDKTINELLIEILGLYTLFRSHDKIMHFDWLGQL